MAPLNPKPLLLSLLSIILFAASAHAICVPRNSAASPSPAPTPSYGHISVTPISQPPESAAPVSSPGPISSSPISQPPETAAPTPSLSYNHISEAPISQPPESAAHVDAAIDKICKSTDYSGLCIASIAPFLNGKNDVESVVGMAIKASIKRTKSAISKATEIASTPSISPRTASTLGDVKDSYEDALENFQKALDALGTRDVGTMNSMLSAAITDFSDSADMLSEMPPEKQLPPFELDATLTNMTSNCLAIVSLMKV